MALPDFTMRQLLEAGVHFGHQTHRWNPKMESYIYGARNGIHVIDLAQTVPLLHQALVSVRDTIAAGGRMLLVGTKRQASEPVAEAARRCAQYYINSRWLGGTMTNWKTISNSIKRLRQLEGLLSAEAQGFTKRELLSLTRERDKLELALGGIKDMGGLPDLLFVIDTNKEAIAIKEANRLGIPVVAVLDTNSDPSGITYQIPGNDDAGRAISLYCDLVARAALEGISMSQQSLGRDIGASEEPQAAEVLPDISSEEPAVEAPAEEQQAAEAAAAQQAG
jgi:small subunit ribosomal protein S2